MFAHCSKFNQPLNWNTTNVTNMSQMFFYCKMFNQSLDLDTSNVTDMSHMFSGCKEFNQDIAWNTSNVTNMSYMFSECEEFNGVFGGGWDTRNVTDMSHMFFNCVNFKQNISTWDVSNVINMDKMFFNSGFSEVGIENWKLHTNANTYEMFSEKNHFIDLKNRSNSIVYTNQTDQGTCYAHTSALVIARLIKVIFSSHFVEKESCPSLYTTGKNLDNIYEDYESTLYLKDCEKEWLSSLLFLLIYYIIVDKYKCSGGNFISACPFVFKYFSNNFKLGKLSKCRIQEIKEKIFHDYNFTNTKKQKLEANLLLLIAIITTFQQFIDNKIINITMFSRDYLNEKEIILQTQKPLDNNIYAYLSIKRKGTIIETIKGTIKGHSICVIKQYQTKTGIKLLTKNSWGMHKGYREIVNDEGYIEPGVLNENKKNFKYYLGYLNYTMTIPEKQRHVYVEQELVKTLKKIIKICDKDINPPSEIVPSEDTKRSFWSRLFTRRTKGGTKKSLYKTHRKLIHKRKTRKYFTPFYIINS